MTSEMILADFQKNVWFDGFYEPLPLLQQNDQDSSWPSSHHYRKFRRHLISTYLNVRFFHLGLFHHVLPYRTQGKLMFPLYKSCADTCYQTPCTHSDHERAIQGTWCNVKLEKALEKGYRILQMHEVWHFLESSDGLFKDYADTFLKFKIKQESSGYPKNCTTEEQKQQYVDQYLVVEGIRHVCVIQADAKLVLGNVF